MTRLIFIRHAATDCLATRLAGRDAEVHLSAAGKVQGQRLAHSLKQQGIAKIYSSPQPRARETAEFLGKQLRRITRGRPVARFQFATELHPHSRRRADD